MVPTCVVPILSQALFDENTDITNANLSGTGAIFPGGNFDIRGANVAGVNFLESNQLTDSQDTILTEYDETLEKYVGANISNTSLAVTPDSW